MDYKKGILVSVITVAVLVAGIFYWQFSHAPEEINLPNTNSNEERLITYTNKRLGFKIKYPDNYFLQEQQPTEGEFFVMLYRKDLSNIQLAASIDVFENKEYEEKIKELKNYKHHEVRSEERIDKVGSKAKKLEIKNNYFNATFTYRVIGREPFVYVFKLVPEDIFSNFKLINIESTSVSEWQEYKNDKFGFKIKHPRDFEIRKEKDYISLVPPRFQNRQGLNVKFMEIKTKKVPAERSLVEVVALEVSPDATFLEDIDKEKLSSFEKELDKMKVDIGKVNAYKIAVSRTNPKTDNEETRCIYFMKNKDNFIEIEKRTIGLKEGSCSKDPTFSRVLSTFKFIN